MNDETAPPSEEVNNEQPSAMDKLLSISNATNIDDAVKWAENASSYMGSSIRLSDSAEENMRKLEAHGANVMLKPDINSPEQMNAMYKAMGRPDEATEYILPEMTDDFKYNKDAADAFTKDAYKYGLTQGQMEGLLRDNAILAMSQQADNERLQYEGIAQLKADLGYAYDEKLSKAADIMRLINPEFDVNNASKEQIEGALRVAEHYGSMASEGTNFNRPAEVSRKSPDEAKSEIKGIMEKLTNMNPNDMEYKSLMAKKHELYREAYPDTGRGDGTARIGGIKFA